MWRNYTLGDVSEIRMGQSPPSESYNENGAGLPFLQGCAEFGRYNPVPKYFCSEKGKVGPNNSVLISVRAPVGNMNIADKDYCIGRGLSSIIGKEISSKYLYYYISHSVSDLQRLAQGSTFEAIGSKELTNHGVYASDDNDVRDQIVKILENVDLAIQKTEELIAKYGQIKQGMMHDLFTRGIDENGQLRPSYDDAPELYQKTELGFFPREWLAKRLGDFCFITKLAGFEYTKYFNYSVGGEIIALRSLNIVGGGLNLDDVHTIPREVSYNLLRSQLKINDIVMGYVGTVGNLAIIDQNHKFHLAPNVAKITVDQDVHGYFVKSFLETDLGQKQIEILSTTTSQPALSMGNIRQILVALPPLREQQKISVSLTSVQDKIKAEQRYLSKLQQHKAGLMQDLLTGRVVVKVEQREAA